MLRSLMLILGLFLIVGSTLAVAEPGSTYQPPDQQAEDQGEASKPKPRSMVGTIVSIDMENKKITIKDEVTGENDEYSFNDSTNFHHNNTLVTIDKMKTGDRVSLHIDSDSNMIVRMDHPSTLPLNE